MSEEDTEYTDHPTCPYCGYIIQCEGDYDGGFYSEEQYEYDCPSCDKPVRSQAYISFSYTTTCIDRAAEKIIEDAKRAKEEERRLKRLAECQEWLPGTKVRIKEDARKADWLIGRTGIVATREICQHNPFVEVDLESRGDLKGYSTFMRPDELERI